jgi:nondiscriminating aspartyl-tRNA synthetase
MTKEKEQKVKMERVLIKDLKNHIGKDVKIAGWVSTIRDHGKVAFIVPRDRSGTVQAVASGDYNETALPESQKLHEQWVVEIVGEVKARPEKMIKDELNGELELGIKEVKVLSEAAELPFAMDAELNLDTLLDNRPLTLRMDRNRKIFKVQETLVQAFAEYFHNEGFTEFQSPKIIGEDAEGTGEVFKVDYFKDKQAYLATSPQLYKQMLVGVFERVFTVGNVYRAEKHATTRHTNEYTSMDAEMGFITDHHDVMNVVSDYLRFAINKIGEKHGDTLKEFEVELPQIPDNVPYVKLQEAQEIIKKETGEDTVGEPDLEPSQERFMGEWAKREHNSDFIFITHYPVSKRPMYTFRDPEDEGMTKSADLLFRGIEIVTCGQRMHNYKELVESMKEKGLNPDNFEFYLQAFKYGMPPHGGFGMGLERLTAKMLGIKTIKETSLFPRDINRIDTLLSKESE